MLKRSFAWFAALSALSALISCSSAPKGPQKGTAAFYWQAARETWATADYSKTMDHLDQLLATENEFRARAVPWALTLTAGLISGYTDLADAYELGARANRQNPTPFRRQVSQYRTLAGKASLHYVEVWDRNAAKLTEANVALPYSVPKGNSAPSGFIGKVGSGIVLLPAEMESAQNQAVERGVLLAACRFAGAANDTAKAAQVLRDGNAQVAKGLFLLTVAGHLYEQSQLYTNDKLDDPQKTNLFSQRALEALKTVPESKESKELNTKVQMALKKTKRT